MSPPVIEDRGGLRVFWCPGCESLHGVNGGWTIAGPDDAPTVTPSVLTQSGHYSQGSAGPCWCTYKAPDGEPSPFVCVRCHLFVRDGKLEFLSDSTHHLAGQTVPMLPLEP